MVWQSEYLLPAGPAPAPEQTAIVDAEQSPEWSVSVPSGSSASATSDTEVASTIDTQTAYAAESAIPDELGPNAIILCKSLANARRLTMESANMILTTNITENFISREEAEMIGGWLRQHIFVHASSPVPGQVQAAVTGSTFGPAPSASVHPGAAPAPVAMTVDLWVDNFLTMQNLDSAAQMQSMLDAQVADGKLTPDEAKEIADRVKEQRLFPD